VKASVEGFVAAGVHCGLKRSGRPDLAVIVSDRPASVAGVFTRNRFPSAAVIVSRRHLRGGRARAAVINSRISNVATGDAGIANAREMCALVAREIGARPGDVQVGSTGVIGWPLPMDKLRAGIPAAVRAARSSGWEGAARAIMTTDTVPKLVSLRLGRARLVGIAKGSGMIQPDMATMLCYLATDLAVEPACLRAALREAVGSTLNAFTIDGETSTSDTTVVLANGAAGNRAIEAGSRKARELVKGLTEACGALAERLAADGEGVTRLADVIVSGTRSDAQARSIARRIANSVLVKTALFGGDPNWGRVVQALGMAGVPFRTDEVSVTFAGVPMLRRGQPVEDTGALKRAARAVRAPRIAIEIGVGRGPGRARVLTTDLSYEYVRVNAEYTT
jgi:glutamate N-acetyltransferase / amino-acid N-acetyltransferase